MRASRFRETEPNSRLTAQTARFRDEDSHNEWTSSKGQVKSPATPVVSPISPSSCFIPPCCRSTTFVSLSNTLITPKIRYWGAMIPTPGEGGGECAGVRWRGHYRSGRFVGVGKVMNGANELARGESTVEIEAR